ncbi:MAG: ATP synthase F1 subunit epsilon [Micavibrio aeruginosavorus]|uniref:ATP synthase epsilon chain n=1 Tax=Micavibrio aeruginosavorus TaxID=349221 RepID=A0A7T5R3Y7_9BACT|nr:MAG: ATP synthase F1 subunit epsilon [Micavibrio aeruginosavorus]
MAEATQATFNFELVSPERRLISEPAKMVVIPGEEGDFGVLPGHSALVATIRPGVVEVHSIESGEVRRIFIAGGFADVTPQSCTILAEEAINVLDLNAEALEKALGNLKEDLALSKDDIERARVTKKINLIQAKVAALSGKIAA